MDSKKITGDAINMALDKGCNNVRVLFSHELQSSFCVRDNFLENLFQSESSSLFFELFINGRYGSCSTNKMDMDSIESLLDSSIQTLIHLEPDSYRRLPPAELYFKAAAQDLKLYDPSLLDLSPEKKKETAFIPSLEVLGKDPRLLSLSSEFCTNLLSSHMADSQGFNGVFQQSVSSLSAECTVQGATDARPTDWWMEAATGFGVLNTRGCGQKALELALEKLHTSKIASGRYSMIADRRVSAQLLDPMLQALSGVALQQKMSFLQESLGKKIVSPLLLLTDRPHTIGADGSRYFDREGLATRDIDIFKDGILQSYYISTYEALKMGCRPTVDGPSLITIENGTGDASTLMKQMGSGIYITALNGGNCNGATGDFSYGIEGFLVENGQKAGALHEMLITGNMLDLWNNLCAVANDAFLWTSRRIPSLLFQNVSFSGF